MNIIDFFKEFEFIKRRRLRSLGGAKICSGGCESSGGRGAPPWEAQGGAAGSRRPPWNRLCMDRLEKAYTVVFFQ